MTNEKNIKLNDTQQKIVEEHYYLAEKIVDTCFINNGITIHKSYSIEDAYQDACYALCKAAYDYDFEHKSRASFKTYASSCMKNYILMRINNHYKKYNNEISLDAFGENNRYDIIDEFEEIEHIHQKMFFESVVKKINEKATTDDSESRCFKMFLLHYQDGVKMKDIAKKYNIAAKAVGKQIQNAKSQLQNICCVA